MPVILIMLLLSVLQIFVLSKIVHKVIENKKFDQNSQSQYFIYISAK